MLSGRIGFQAAALALLAALIPLLILGCGGSTPATKPGDWPEGKPKVVVSFAPLYCFAASVAGDDATVRNVMTTTGPHDFSPTESDARLVSKADLFFVVGLGLDESKAELMKKGSGNEKLKIVELGEKIPEKQLCEGFCDHADHKDDPNHHHDKDPHVWLSPDLAEVMVNAIRDELKAADPAHAAGYDQRAAAYVARLKQLKSDGQAMLRGKKDNRIVSFHDSLAYFAECFNLDIRGVLTQKPGQEPDARQMQKLIRICTDANKPTRVIAVEPQFSTSTSGETLRKDLAPKGVKNPVLVEIDTLETVKPDELAPDWYEKKMRENLNRLSGALE
jgi:ABC-type Zn uptake system ZnuABC Zn-binding protein ZnuA